MQKGGDFMISKKIFVPFAALFLVASSTAYATHVADKFKTDLSSAEEVAPVTSAMTGKAKFKVSKDNSQIEFKLKVKDAVAVTGAYLHCGEKGQNGPIVAHLFGTIPGGFDVDGELAAFTLKNQNIVQNAGCTPQILTISDLANAMRNGKIYVNVHTVAYPNGEIRGQLTND